MKIGLGLYRHRLTRDDYDSARQARWNGPHPGLYAGAKAVLEGSQRSTERVPTLHGSD
jgi:hypothetical protein